MDDQQSQQTVTTLRPRFSAPAQGAIRLQSVKRIKLPFVPPRAEKEEKSFVLGYN